MIIQCWKVIHTIKETILSNPLRIKKKKASNKYVCVCIYIYSATNTSIYKLIRVRAKTSIDDSCRIKTQLQDG